MKFALQKLLTKTVSLRNLDKRQHSTGLNTDFLMRTSCSGKLQRGRISPRLYHFTINSGNRDSKEGRSMTLLALFHFLRVE